MTVVAFLVSAVPSSMSAQILEWTDASGSRHFTNDPEDIPPAQRDDARVVVRQRRPQVTAGLSAPGDAEQRLSSDSERPAARGQREERGLADERSRVRRQRERRRWSREEAPNRQAQVVYDRSRERSEVVMLPAPPPPVVQEVRVNIAGPLAVSQVVVDTAPTGPYGYGYDGGYYGGYYGPEVSTSFDRGRYRHRTVRMHLQEHFQYDRDGPYLYVPRRTPRGPIFHERLPRGLSPGRVADGVRPTTSRLRRISSHKHR